ncbi:interleukin-18 receptor 1-like isoform X2 [Ambystoma mexicanum]|uniref:interleukin-18 receptor 1-like isoform X2 n=1 Tax=Ambystoma mexicanum TaxID=8296 RepID=UPI0037E98E15
MRRVKRTCAISAGSTQLAPLPCTLEGDFSLLTCAEDIPEHLTGSQRPRNAITWFKKHEKNGWVKLNPESQSRIVVNEKNLEFWPAEVNDTGDYLCVIGNDTRDATNSPLFFNVTRRIPEYCFNTLCALESSETEGISTAIVCGSAEAFPNIVSRTWYKGCDYYAKDTLRLQFNNLHKADSGKYSCVATIIHQGKMYNYTKTIELQVTDPVEMGKPDILGDSITTETTEIGMTLIINCTGYLGPYDNTLSISFYWLKINTTNADDVDFCNRCTEETQEWPCETESWMSVLGGSKFISQQLKFQSVKEVDLEYTYVCKLDNPIENKMKSFILIKKVQAQDIPTHSFTTGIVLAIVLPLLFLFLLIGCLLFRIELVLFYRRATNKDETKADGKEYDAYVSYRKDSPGDDEAEKKFALEILAHTLEEHFGYKLCIFERDFMPGGTIAEDTNSFIDKSRRLIIVLSPNYTLDNSMYELESGLYKSLVEKQFKVILIEYNIDDNYTFMPESLDLLKSSAKVKWKGDKSLPNNSGFWKRMQYLMPAKPIKSKSSARFIPNKGGNNGNIVVFSAMKKYVNIEE